MSSGSLFEDIMGFSRAVRAGDYIAVSGNAPLDKDKKTRSIGDPALPAGQCVETKKSTQR